MKKEFHLESPEVLAARRALLDLDIRYSGELDRIRADGNNPREYDRVWAEWISQVEPLERVIGA